MEIYKTACFIGDDAKEVLFDTVWHKGHWWLVSNWLEHPTTKHAIPERIIQLDGRVLKFQEVSGHPYRFLANNSIPTAVLDGSAPSEYVVEIHPMARAHIRRS